MTRSNNATKSKAQRDGLAGITNQPRWGPVSLIPLTQAKCSRLPEMFASLKMEWDLETDTELKSTEKTSIHLQLRLGKQNHRKGLSDNSVLGSSFVPMTLTFFSLTRTHLGQELPPQDTLLENKLGIKYKNPLLISNSASAGPSETLYKLSQIKSPNRTLRATLSLPTKHAKIYAQNLKSELLSKERVEIKSAQWHNRKSFRTKLKSIHLPWARKTTNLYEKGQSIMPISK